MQTDHTSIEAMRAYLLGRLPDDEAAALEEEYFVNWPFLLKLQSEETALIEDYLDGSLEPADKQSFEKQYLQSPALLQKVEEIRRQRGAVAQPMTAKPPIWTNWRFSFAAALILVLGVGIWMYHLRGKEQTRQAVQVQVPAQAKPSAQSQPTTQEKSSAQVPSDRPKLWAQGRPPVPVESAKTEPLPVLPAPIAVYLVPSITQGMESRQRQFTQPSSDATLNLILELPGTSSVVDAVEISSVGPDGSLRPVWSSPKPRTQIDRPRAFAWGGSRFPRTTTVIRPLSLGADGQVLALSLPGSLFQPGDYMVTASIAPGGVHAKYMYRVLAPQSSGQP